MFITHMNITHPHLEVSHNLQVVLEVCLYVKLQKQTHSIVYSYSLYKKIQKLVKEQNSFLFFLFFNCISEANVCFQFTCWSIFLTTKTTVNNNMHMFTRYKLHISWLVNTNTLIYHQDILFLGWSRTKVFIIHIFESYINMTWINTVLSLHWSFLILRLIHIYSYKTI